MVDLEKKTILLVEDEMLVANYTAKIIKSFGYEVIIAYTGEKAVEFATGNHSINLVLMDIDLGRGMNGTKAAELILKKRNLPIVFHTSHSEEEIVDTVKGLTRYGYVVKNSGEFVLKSSMEMAFELFKAHSDITRQMEILREREESLSITLQSIGDGVIVTDITGNITKMNPTAERLTGWTFQDASSKPLNEVFNIINAKTREKVTNPVTVVLKTNRTIGLANHTILICKDGKEYHITDSSAPIKDKNGNLKGVILVFSDNTEKYKAAEALLESENRYRLLFENLNDGFCLNEIITDEKGEPVDFRFISCNEVYEEHTGLKKGDILGKTIREIIPNADLNQIKEYGKVALSGKPFKYEYYSKTFNRHFKVSAYSPEKNFFATIFEDISEQKKVEELTRESEKKYIDLVETSQDLIWQCDINGNYIYLNPAWEEVFGYKISEMLGKSFTHFQKPDIAQRDQETFNRIIQGGSIKNFETVHLGKNGNEIYLVFNAKYTLDKNGKVTGTRGTAYDITSRKQNEEKIASLLKAKEGMLKEVHHRVKNNLNVISSLLGMHSQSINEPAAIAALEEARTRLHAMQILYTKLYNSENFVEMSLSEYLPPLINEIFQIYPIKSQIKIITEIENIKLEVKTLSALGILLNELVTNSMKYAFSGRKHGLISLKAYLENNLITVIFEDDGIGIPETINFQNAHGFGLQLINMLTEQLNGTISLERNKGTKFTLKFEAA